MKFDTTRYLIHYRDVILSLHGPRIPAVGESRETALLSKYLRGVAQHSLNLYTFSLLEILLCLCYPDISPAPMSSLFMVKSFSIVPITNETVFGLSNRSTKVDKLS